MKEIRILKQQLRNFPDDLFVIAYSANADEKCGLVIVDEDMKEKGFIETGDFKEMIIK